MNFLKNRNTRALIFIMCALVLSVVVVSHFYYKRINNAVDARIVPARTLYEKYNGYAQLNEFDSIFWLMDTIEAIYSSYNHYKSSYEIGVLYNNRAASYLTLMQLSKDENLQYQDSLNELAAVAANRSVEIYEHWLQRFDSMDDNEIGIAIETEFLSGLKRIDTERQEKYLQNRVKEIKRSQTETRRRLSVSYTNLGVVHRQRQQYKDAAISYQKAITLWDRNLTAENNLNKLLGRPVKTRSLIQKLFPPERD